MNQFPRFILLIASDDFLFLGQFGVITGST